jgi:hypothetical protein
MCAAAGHPLNYLSPFLSHLPLTPFSFTFLQSLRLENFTSVYTNFFYKQNIIIKDYKGYSIPYNTKQDTKSLEKTHMILTPIKKRNTRIANKLPTKPHPEISFNVIQKRRCIQNNSIENHVVSMFPNIPRYCQPNHP